MQLVATEKETYDFLDFEAKLRKEIEIFFIHEKKRFDPVYEKIDSFKKDIESFRGDFDAWNSKLKQN